MKRHKQSAIAIAILAAFGLLGLVTPATAADETGAKKSEGETTTAPIPAWRSFGSSGDEEDLEETFFRLAQDFVSTSEIGVRRLGPFQAAMPGETQGSSTTSRWDGSSANYPAPASRLPGRPTRITSSSLRCADSRAETDDGEEYHVDGRGRTGCSVGWTDPCARRDP